MKKARKIYISLPVKNELENIPNVLQCIKNQTFKNFELWLCVNQPDNWWQDEQRIIQCKNNQQTISYLKSIKEIPINILDYSSPGNGWKGKKEGIGWARKVLMDAIVEEASPQDIVISMDADTFFGPDYFSSVVQRFDECPKALGLLNPYYHKLEQDDELNRNMLRYEIYMRHYTLNLWRIESPYAFAAMGSIISFPVWAYKKVGGMVPKKSGEDFYFVQNIIKTGVLLRYNNTTVFPGTRYSDRVYFGTGPALIKGKNNDWGSYPLYPAELFNKISLTYRSFPALFEKNIETPLDGFIEKTFGVKNIWKPLRDNFKNKEKFIHACHSRLDGLRILQYLKSNHHQSAESDNMNFVQFMAKNFPDEVRAKNLSYDNFSFNSSEIEVMNLWRDLLFELEMKYQHKHYISVCDV